MKRKVVLPTLKRSSRKRKATNVVTRGGVAANVASTAVHANKQQAMRNAMVPGVQRHTSSWFEEAEFVCAQLCPKPSVILSRESVLI